MGRSISTVVMLFLAIGGSTCWGEEAMIATSHDASQNAQTQAVYQQAYQDAYQRVYQTTYENLLYQNQPTSYSEPLSYVEPAPEKYVPRDSGCSSCCRSGPAPTMIGDSLGLPFVAGDGFEFHMYPNFYSRVADNNSAVPQDRVFFNYKFISEVPVALDFGGNAPDYYRDLSFYEFGFEKTLFGDNLSAEVLVPFATLPQSTNVDGPGLQSDQTELQNIAFGLKGVLWRNEVATFSAGARVEAPTKEGVRTSSVQLPRDVWAITPYLATLVNVNDRMFFQAFTSYRVQLDDVLDSNNFVLREPNYLIVDGQLGYWLYQNSGGCGLTGLQAIAELHYTATFEGYTPIGLPVNYGGHHDFLNVTTGFTATFSDKMTVTLGMVLPIRDGGDVSIANVTRPIPSDRLFDWEAVLQASYYFGTR